MEIVLVHGSYHGAWCWDLLRPELEARGHVVTAVDLPISDPTAGADRYADVVTEAIATIERPVVVGHSMAGLVIPIVATRRPVDRLVFIAAFLPRPGVSANDQRAAEPVDSTIPPSTAEWTSLGDDVWAVGCSTATELFFNDVPPDVATWACDRLRPQAYRVMNEPSPLASWPVVDSRTIVCRADRAINPDWVVAASRDRLGVQPIEIDGGHSPFLSRPADLAAILDAIVREGR